VCTPEERPCARPEERPVASLLRRVSRLIALGELAPHALLVAAQLGQLVLPQCASQEAPVESQEAPLCASLAVLARRASLVAAQLGQLAQQLCESLAEPAQHALLVAAQLGRLAPPQCGSLAEQPREAQLCGSLVEQPREEPAPHDA